MKSYYPYQCSNCSLEFSRQADFNDHKSNCIITQQRKDQAVYEHQKELDKLGKPGGKFDSLLDEIKSLHDKKAHDYAKDSDRFSNFKEAAIFSGVKAEDTFEVLLGIKQARLLELKRGKTPKNESIRDTLLDRAVYSILALQFYDENK